MPTEIRETTVRTVKQKPGSEWAYLTTTDTGPWKGSMVKDIMPGTWIKAEGEWRREGNYPRTFNVVKVLQIEKGDVAKAWLQWRLSDVGDVRASALSEQFGESLPDVLDDSAQATEALSSLRGMTPERVRKTINSYLEHKGELRLTMWLGANGLNWSAIKATIDHYTEDENGHGDAQSNEGIREIVTKDPYTLMVIDGITFEDCDLLAEGLGVELHDPRRLRAMVWSKLEELAGRYGETFLPLANLLKAMSSFGHAPDALVNLLNESEHFTVTRMGAQLLRYRDAEISIARRMDAWEESEQTEMDLHDIRARFPHLDPSQLSAIGRLLTAPVSILTGGPGTGKTTVLKTALTLMEERGERVRLASFTGKAAKRMTEATGRGATTIHKMLEWKPVEGWTRDRSNPLETDVVVIDEASMLDEELASALMEAIGQGTRLILVGDVNQLPPVGAGQPLLDLLKSGKVPVFRLTQTHRQGKDSWVIDNAARILEGKLPSLQTQSDFRFILCPTSAKIIEAAVHIYKAAREKGVDKQLQMLTPEHKSGAGTTNLNFAIQKAMNPLAADPNNDQKVSGAADIAIFAGDKVIYTKNTVTPGLVNGSMGVVESIHIVPHSSHAWVRFEGDINPETGDDRFRLSDAALKPLMLAYALTVHKAQGSEWANVVVIADKAHFSLRRKLLYTAITRTSKNLMILGTEEAVARGAKNNPDENRATLLQERLRGEKV